MDDLNSLFKNTDTNLFSMLSVIVENQATNKAMLQVIISELSSGSPEKENELIDLANQLKNEELQSIVKTLIDNRS